MPDSGEDWVLDARRGMLVATEEASGLRRYQLSAGHYDEIVPGIFLGPAPDDYDSLAGVVDCVLDCRPLSDTTRERIAATCRALGLEFGHFGFDDGVPPPEATLRDALSWLGERHRDGRRCLVHCSAGISRSPFLVALFLRKTYRCWWPRRPADRLAALNYVRFRHSPTAPAEPFLEYLRRG